MDDLVRQCVGEPPGSCVTLIRGRQWCRSCLTRRQESLALGLPLGLPTPIGIIIQDLDAPILMCACTGVATSPRHKESLLHREWAWRQSQGADR